MTNLVLWYLIPACVTFICAMLTILKKDGPNRAQTIMAITYILLAVSMVAFAMHFSPQYHDSILFDSIFKIVAPFTLSTYMLFIRSMTSTKGIIAKDLYYFAPSVFNMFVIIVISNVMTPADVQYYSSHLMGREKVDIPGTTIAATMMIGYAHHAFRIIFPLLCVNDVLLGVIRTRRFHKRLLKYYADADDTKVASLRSITSSTGAIVLLAFFHLLAPNMYSVPSWIIVISIMSEVFIAISIAYYTDSIKNTAVELIQLSDEEEHIEESQIGQSQLKTQSELYQKLIKACEQDKIYLRHDLSLASLSEYLGTNRQYMYNVIRFNVGTTFSDFINSQRIEYAKNLILSTPRSELVYKRIADESGYQSQASFYRNFNAIVGCTPTEWLAKQDQKK